MFQGAPEHVDPLATLGRHPCEEEDHFSPVDWYRHDSLCAAHLEARPAECRLPETYSVEVEGRWLLRNGSAQPPSSTLDARRGRSAPQFTLHV